MKNFRHIEEYTGRELYEALQALAKQYDLVHVVDVQECRVLEIQPDGGVRYGEECYRIWNRSVRCANCTGYQACMTHRPRERVGIVDGRRMSARSVPIYLEMAGGELVLCVLDCVNYNVPGDGPSSRIHDDATYINSHDVLTQLYTEEKLFWEIRQRLIDNPGEDYLLVMGNILNFRLVNKLYGIEGGNRILVGVADILRSECTHEEVYGRYRDDRFVLLVKRKKFDEQRFSVHLQRARGLVDSPIYSIQIQLGVYAIQDVNIPVATMMERASLALESIRGERGASIAHYEPGMTARKLKAQHIVEDFEQALENRDFHIYLQPQVTGEGVVQGAEALVRWIRPNGDVIPPMEFLDVLHESDLLSHLDAYVWELAVAQLSRWKGTEFEGLFISVNVDPGDFFYFDVPGMLAQLCRAYAVDPRLLRVEITETALSNDAVAQGRVVDELHREGFLVEIDDFGKGSSSLSMLKDIHADVLKIDMGFVRGKSNVRRSRIILESVIEMAEHLNMGVITEGVETRAQVDSLVEMGCRHFQGYYFSHPIPVEDFETVVRARNEEHGRV